MERQNRDNKKFIDNFNFEKNGFFDISEFTNVSIGFSSKKKLYKNDTKKASMVSIYIPKRAYKKNQKNQLYIHATYGKIAENGIEMRQNRKLTEPVDAEFPKEYFYDLRDNAFYKKNKKINADELLSEVYKKHILPTKPVRGLWMRVKMIFWWNFMKFILKFIASFFHYVLLCISGIKYLYSPIFREEKINDVIVKSDIEDFEKNQTKPELKEGKKLKIFNYEASQWSIIFYSTIHLVIFLFFVKYNYYPDAITKIFKNNFITLVYAIFSLWVIEYLMPKIIMLLIKLFSGWSFKSAYKSIKL